MGYLENREAQARQDYENEIEAAKNKLDRVLAAIATLRGDTTVAPDAPPRSANKTTLRSPKESSKTSSTPIEINGVQIVKEISVLMSGEYDNRVFLKKAEEIYPIVSKYSKLVRDTLSKLAKTGKYGIETVQPRKGRIPAIYRTINSSQEAEG